MNIKLMMSILSLLLSGCLGIDGFWNLSADPSVGENITPPRDYWTRPGETVEERTRQWMECGGLEDGWYGSSVVKPSERGLTLKEQSEIRREDRSKTSACMIGNGYRYIGICSNEYSRSFISCREKTMDKFPPYEQQSVFRIGVGVCKDEKNRHLIACQGRVLNRYLPHPQDELKIK